LTIDRAGLTVYRYSCREYRRSSDGRGGGRGGGVVRSRTAHFCMLINLKRKFMPKKSSLFPGVLQLGPYPNTALLGKESKDLNLEEQLRLVLKPTEFMNVQYR
jgi:hypothetical protein